jgi:hypothetical protein
LRHLSSLLSTPFPKREGMARKTITVTTSDWSGTEITDEKQAWQLTLKPGDGRKAQWIADLPMLRLLS